MCQNMASEKTEYSPYSPSGRKKEKGIININIIINDYLGDAIKLMPKDGKILNTVLHITLLHILYKYQRSF